MSDNEDTNIDLTIAKGGTCICWVSKGDDYIALYPKNGTKLTSATIARLHRAQLRLAGLPVSGWPFNVLEDDVRSAFSGGWYAYREAFDHYDDEQEIVERSLSVRKEMYIEEFYK